MPKELIGMVINPKKKGKSKEKKKTKVKKNPSKRRTSRSKNLILITNPTTDTRALLELALGTAAGLAG